MDSPRISKLRFLSAEGPEIEGPNEWVPCLVEVLVDYEEWDRVALRRQGEPLDLYVKVVGGSKRVLADWPRSDTGYYRLRLDAPEWREERVVEVWPQKIGRETYARLLEDLETRLPVAVAVALQQAGGLAGVELPPLGETTLAQELVRLKMAVRGTDTRPGLDRVLPEIAKGPHQMLVSEEMWVKREQARRPHPARLALAYASGYNLDNKGQALRIVDTRVEHTANVYENRLVKLYTEQVAQRLRRLANVAIGSQHAGLRERSIALLWSLKELGGKHHFWMV